MSIAFSPVCSDFIPPLPHLTPRSPLALRTVRLNHSVFRRDDIGSKGRAILETEEDREEITRTRWRTQWPSGVDRRALDGRHHDPHHHRRHHHRHYPVQPPSHPPNVIASPYVSRSLMSLPCSACSHPFPLLSTTCALNSFESRQAGSRVHKKRHEQTVPGVPHQGSTAVLQHNGPKGSEDLKAAPGESWSSWQVKIYHYDDSHPMQPRNPLSRSSHHHPSSDPSCPLRAPLAHTPSPCSPPRVPWIPLNPGKQDQEP
jgi:hypothetical protein